MWNFGNSTVSWCVAGPTCANRFLGTRWTKVGTRIVGATGATLPGSTSSTAIWSEGKMFLWMTWQWCYILIQNTIEVCFWHAVRERLQARDELCVGNLLFRQQWRWPEWRGWRGATLEPLQWICVSQNFRDTRLKLYFVFSWTKCDA